jgi:hypothetical protein
MRDESFFAQGEVLYEHLGLRAVGESNPFEHLGLAADEWDPFCAYLAACFRLEMRSRDGSETPSSTIYSKPLKKSTSMRNSSVRSRAQYKNAE